MRYECREINYRITGTVSLIFDVFMFIWFVMRKKKNQDIQQIYSVILIAREITL